MADRELELMLEEAELLSEKPADQTQITGIDHLNHKGGGCKINTGLENAFYFRLIVRNAYVLLCF